MHKDEDSDGLSEKVWREKPFGDPGNAVV